MVFGWFNSFPLRHYLLSKVLYRVSLTIYTFLLVSPFLRFPVDSRLSRVISCYKLATNYHQHTQRYYKPRRLLSLKNRKTTGAAIDETTGHGIYNPSAATHPSLHARPHSRLTHVQHSRSPASLRWLRGAPLTRYGDHVSGLDHSEPVLFWAKEKPATCEGSGLGELRWLMPTCGGAGSGADC